MSQNPAQSDPLALRVAARSGPRSPRRLAHLVRSSLALAWSSGRALVIGLVALQVLGACALAAQVLAVQQVLHAVFEAQSTGETRDVVAPVVALAAASALSAVTGAVQGQLQRLLGETVARTMWGRVLGVATGVGLRHFESDEFHNRLSRVQTSALVRPYQVTQGLLTVGGTLVAGLGLGLTLLSISPLLIPLVVMAGVPILVSSVRESRLEFEFTVRQTPAVRQRGYLALLQTGRDEAKEVRAFGLGGWLRGRFEDLYAVYLRDLRRHVLRRSLLALAGQLASAAVLTGTLLALVLLVTHGRIDIAGAGAAIVAIRLLATQVQSLFRGLQSIFESGLFLDDLDEFLALGRAGVDEDTGSSAPPGFATLRAEGVSFRYPGAAVDAVRTVDLELLAGEVVALVGENGSGKTTLAKLLAGLYQPAGGQILWDGRDAATFKPSSLRERITVVFQDFVRYALTATENVALGRVEEPVDEARVRAAVAAAGAEDTLDSLPHGFDTILSRLFAGGTDLSGGQWQRVALARSFYRDAPLVILDEPSASLDPRSEHELFSTLRETLRGRTALFISHRFSTVRGADRIYVLHGGEVVEVGSHEQLMTLDGRYAELYRLQSDAYVAGH